MAGCSGGKDNPTVGTNYYYPKQEEKQTTERETEAAEVKADTALYMIIQNDMTTQQLMLRQMTSGKQMLHSYSLTTRFLDKYGNNASVSLFEPGRIVTIGNTDTTGKLKEVRLSGEVWEYENVVRYKIEEDRGVFQIADTKYFYNEEIFVVSDERQIELSEIKENDELRVIGMEKQILSVAITTGHGMVQLKNTEIFEGSFIQIGKRIFAEITGEMQLEVPEGAYTITVANKGYGGSKEIEVKRDEITEIDLEELKGEGPKKGKITFEILSEADEEEVDAVLELDGEEVDYSDAVELDYGLHTIQITAENYEKYSKKLFVNSEEATITVILEETGTVSNEEEETPEAEEDEQEPEDAEAADEETADEETADEETVDEETAEADTNEENADEEDANEEDEQTAETDTAGTQAGSQAGNQAGAQAGSQAGNQAGGQAGSLAGTLSGEEERSNVSEEQESLTEEQASDYLSTLTELLGNTL